MVFEKKRKKNDDKSTFIFALKQVCVRPKILVKQPALWSIVLTVENPDKENVVLLDPEIHPGYSCSLYTGDQTVTVKINSSQGVE